MKYIQIHHRLLLLGLACFTPQEFTRAVGGTKIGSRKLLERYTKNGIFKRIKNGFYVSTNPKPNLWVVANKIYRPSYISLETALSYYGIIPESVYSTTSVTPKPTRTFTIDNNVLVFRKIKQKAFTGYKPIKIATETVFIAETEKALADYLYFTFLDGAEINDRIIWDKIKSSSLTKHIKNFQNSIFERWAKNVIRK